MQKKILKIDFFPPHVGSLIGIFFARPIGIDYLPFFEKRGGQTNQLLALVEKSGFCVIVIYLPIKSHTDIESVSQQKVFNFISPLEIIVSSLHEKFHSLCSNRCFIEVKQIDLDIFTRCTLIYRVKEWENRTIEKFFYNCVKL